MQNAKGKNNHTAVQRYFGAMEANVPELVLGKMKRAKQSSPPSEGNKRICLVKRWMEYNE